MPKSQYLLAKFYGPPPFFGVTFLFDEKRLAEPVIRHEFWIYPHRRAAFEFLDGKYRGRHETSPARPDVRAPVPFGPERIRPDLTLEELTAMVGHKPIKNTPMASEETGSTIEHDFGNGMSALFTGSGRLIQVGILPGSGLPAGRAR
jgi:hypothetical protein